MYYARCEKREKNYKVPVFLGSQSIIFFLCWSSDHMSPCVKRRECVSLNFCNRAEDARGKFLGIFLLKDSRKSDSVICNWLSFSSFPYFFSPIAKIQRNTL